ncbi:hypothetical protein EJB05_12321, partial [Eragrostis curvula]
MAGVREEEFDEGEVWDVLQEDQVSTESPAPLVATPPRNRRGKKAAVSTVVADDGARRSNKARPSAPVAIPAGSGSSLRRRGDEQDDEDGDEMLPPHEWLARKMERMGGVSAPASPPEVCGGRSKGREMRKVRDAVLPKTAFSEQSTSMAKLSPFKMEHPLEKRQDESARIREKYPDRIPVIVEKAGKSDVPEIDKKKYLVPADLTVGQFVYVVRKRIKLSPEKAIFIFVKSTLPPTASLMSAIYEENKDEDGFLYMTYSGENTFGSA